MVVIDIEEFNFQLSNYIITTKECKYIDKCNQLYINGYRGNVRVNSCIKGETIFTIPIEDKPQFKTIKLKKHNPYQYVL